MGTYHTQDTSIRAAHGCEREGRDGRKDSGVTDFKLAPLTRGFFILYQSDQPGEGLVNDEKKKSSADHARAAAPQMVTLGVLLTRSL